MVFNPDRPFSFTTWQRLQGWQLECRVQIIKLLTSSCQIHDLPKGARQILQCPQESRTPCVNYYVYMSNMSFTSNSFTCSNIFTFLNFLQFDKGLLDSALWLSQTPDMFQFFM